MKSRAIAIAATRTHPFQAMDLSIKRFAHAAVDFMYGTPERTRITYAFATAMAILGMTMDAANAHAALMYCGADTLAVR